MYNMQSTSENQFFHTHFLQKNDDRNQQNKLTNARYIVTMLYNESASVSYQATTIGSTIWLKINTEYN